MEDYIFNNEIKNLLNFIFKNKIRKHKKNEYNLYIIYLYLQYYKENNKFLFNIDYWHINKNLLTLQCIYDHIRNNGYKIINIENKIKFPHHYKLILNVLENIPEEKLKHGLCISNLFNNGYVETRNVYISDFDTLINRIPIEKKTVISLINQ